MKFKFTLSILMLFALIFSANAQDKGSGPIIIGITAPPLHVPSIASRTDLPPADLSETEAQDERANGNKTIIGKDSQTEDDYYTRNRNSMEGKIPGKAPSLVFTAASSSSQPTDPSIGVGPNHAMVIFNTGFRIFDKAGNPLTGQISPNPTIFPAGGCCDLTVSYDNAADRFVLTFLGNGAQIAVSDGPNPLTSGWFVYTIPQIDDYQKLSVWSDGYYITQNSGDSNKVYALERAKMLLGDPAQIIGFPLPGLITSGFYSPQAFNVTNNNLPAAGNAPIVYMQDDAWSGVSQDHVKLWLVNVDYVTPANSTISAPQQLITTPFIGVFDGGSFSNLAQPGGGTQIDALQATIMNQAQFRKFGDHNSAVFDFVVDTDASSGKLAAVRWFELRQDADGQPWSIFQEGTYSAPEGRHAWHASMAMDSQGNIGMGYSSMAGPTTPDPTTKRLSSYYTGRFANDPINTMTIAEELILAGNANIPGTRYGDYSKIDVDPSDDKTFWFDNEMMSSGRKNIVGVFRIAANTANDVGVISIDAPVDGALTASEQITVTVFNFGTSSQSNFPVRYQVDGGALVTEMFTGTLTSSTSAPFTFATTANLSNPGQTYSITASTNLAGDEDNSNDAVTKEVTNVFANDIGVTDITAPSNGDGLGNEMVSIQITNFGSAEQSNFEVSYTLDGNAPVAETVTATVAAGATLDYTFATLGDFSAFITHTLSARTNLAGDQDPSNDEFSTTVSNSSCESNTNNTIMPVGPNAGDVTESIIAVTNDFVVGDVNVTVNIQHTFDADIEIKLVGPDNTEVVLSNRNGGSGDNYTNTVFDDEGTNAIAGGTPPFTGTFVPDESLSAFDGGSSLGDWTLVITDFADLDGGQLDNWTLQLCDETVAGIADNFIEDNEMLIIDKGNDHFSVELPTTTITDRLTINVTNILGQILASYKLENNGSGYQYDLDMSYAASGVYIVTLGNDNMKKSKRLIVK